MHAQKEYKGKVIDAETGEPIPYVNIGIFEKGIGTVSDKEGLFHLLLPDNEVETINKVLFSSLGYASLNIQVAEMPLIGAAYPIFKMEPSNISLDEVIVSSKKNHFITDFIGYRNKGFISFYGYWKDKIAVSGELATKIKAKTGKRKLNKFQFEVVEVLSDSLLIRVNVYDNDGNIGRPKTNLNNSQKNILATIKKGDKIVRIDLKPFEISVENDFFMSIELLKIYGKEELGLVLAATFEENGSYRKYASHDKWEFLSDTNMAYYLETEFMVSKNVAQRYEKREIHTNKKNEEKAKLISGFTLYNGKTISGVEVINKKTKKKFLSDNLGRYTIMANEKDNILFSKDGYISRLVTVGQKAKINISMQRGGK